MKRIWRVGVPIPYSAFGRKAEGSSPFMRAATIVSMLLTLVVLYPLLIVVIQPFIREGNVSVVAFQEAWHEPNIVQVITQTVVLVFGCTIIATGVAVAFAWLNERTDARIGRLTDQLPIIPLLLPPIAGSIGWVMLASPQAGYMNVAIRNVFSWSGIQLETGPLNVSSWYGLAFVYILYLVPYVYVVASAALRNLDPALEEAARTFGASRFRTFIRVTAPSIWPSILSGILLALIIGFALYSVPAIIGTQARIETLSVRMVRLVITDYPPRSDVAIVLGLFILTILATVWVVQRRILRRGHHASVGGRGSRSSRITLGKWRWMARTAMILYILATLILPLGTLTLVSMQSYWSARIDWGSLNLNQFVEVFENGTTRGPLSNSITYALAAALGGMLVALMVSVRQHLRAGGAVNLSADAAGKITGAVSHIIIAIAFLVAFARPPFLLHGTAWILILAYTVLYMPQASVTAQAALSRVGRDMSEAGLVSGAGHGRVVSRILLPLSVAGLTGGFALVFVLSAGDITASVILSSVNTPVTGSTLLQIWESGSYPWLAAFALIFSLLSSIVVLSVLALARRVDFGSKSSEKQKGSFIRSRAPIA